MQVSGDVLIVQTRSPCMEGSESTDGDYTVENGLGDCLGGSARSRSTVLSSSRMYSGVEGVQARVKDPKGENTGK